MKSNGNLYRESYNDFPQPRIIRGNINRIIREGATFSLDCIDSSGNSYRRVRMLMPMGGSPNNFTIIPYEEGQEVYLITMAPNDPVYCIGSLYHPSYEQIHNFVPVVSTNNDVQAFSKNDFVVKNYDNFFALTPTNGAILNTDTNVRIQLGEAGKLRISRGSQAGEYVLGASQFMVERQKYIEELDAKIVKMEEHLGHLTDTVNSILTGLLSFGNAGQAPVLSAPLAAAFADAVAPNTSAQTANTELGALEKRTPLEHQQDCSKAINLNVLIPKNNDSE